MVQLKQSSTIDLDRILRFVQLLSNPIKVFALGECEASRERIDEDAVGFVLLHGLGRQ